MAPCQWIRLLCALKSPQGQAIVESDLFVDIDIEKSKLRYYKKLPETYDIDGKLIIEGSRLEGENALLPSPGDAPIRITGGNAIIPENHIRQSDMIVTAMMEGSAQMF